MLMTSLLEEAAPILAESFLAAIGDPALDKGDAQGFVAARQEREKKTPSPRIRVSA